MAFCPFSCLLRLPSLLQFLKQQPIYLFGTISLLFKHKNHGDKHYDRNENNPASNFFHEIKSQTHILTASITKTKHAKKYEAIDAGLGALFACPMRSRRLASSAARAVSC
jgi:hypothetical protein